MSDSTPAKKTVLTLEVASGRVTFSPSDWPRIQAVVGDALAAPDTGYKHAPRQAACPGIRATARRIGLESPLRKAGKNVN